VSPKRNGTSFFPEDENRGISLIEAVAYASCDELIELETKIDRLVTRAVRRPASTVATRKKIAGFVIGKRMASKYRIDKRRTVMVWAEWSCLAHRAIVDRQRRTVNLVLLLVEIEGRSVLGIAASKTASQIPEESLIPVWGKELGSALYDGAKVGEKLHAWAQRMSPDRIAVPTGRLRCWAELMLFKWKPMSEPTLVEFV